MRKTLLFSSILSLFILHSPILSAGPVSPDKAAVVARNFMSSLRTSKSAVVLDKTPRQWAYDGIYLFACQGGGWVMVAADDDVKPVLAYSTVGTIDVERIPIALQRWLEGYQEQIDAVRSYRAMQHVDAPSYQSDKRDWYMLERGLAPKDGEGDTVAPLLSTRWDQYFPYNAMCPSGTVSGCAATAQTQFMKFWNFPAFGTGSHSYVSPRVGTVESADFGHTLYDWSNMRDSTSQYVTNEEVEAVATLMYHCGVSLEMDYGTAASGGSSAIGLAGTDGIHSIDNSLKDYFHYSRDMQVHFKVYGYNNASWRALLIDELNQGHPILYAGAAEQGGHGFICDGYDSRQYLHFNFGWSGIGDGFYTVDSISPGVGGAGGNGTYTFNLQNAALIGAVPDYAMRVSDTLFNFTRNGGTDSLLFCINETVNTTWSVSSSAAWLTVDEAQFGRAGWVRFHVAESDEDGERVATLTFVQGNETVTVRVVQLNLNSEDMCPLTVVMESTHGRGWQGGAYLSLESPNGYVYGTAQLEAGQRDSVVIMVAPKDVYSVWHSGGGTDRYINYWVRNQYGENFVEAEYAYLSGGTDLIPWPCGHVDIPAVDRQSASLSVFPNPVGDVLHVGGADLLKVEVIDLGGRKVAESNNDKIDVSQLPKGHYFVRIVTSTGSSVRRVVKK